MQYEIVHISELRPLEKVFKNHLDNIRKMILHDGSMHKAIIADKKTGTILDGSHRYAFLYGEGYKFAPVKWVDYLDENIRVGTSLSNRFLIEGETKISKQECLRRSLEADLFYPRTTRHFFTFRKSDISARLVDLQQGDARSVEHLCAEIGIQEEIEHNKKYLKEIDEELKILSSYIAEMVESRTYLNNQVDLLTNSLPTVLFPGKFHPPHLGHLQTIISIAAGCRKLIIGVTEDVPDGALMSHAEIIEILSNIAGNFNNIEVMPIQGILVNKKNINDLPYFDLLLSGNPKVIEWAEDMNIKAQFTPRSFGEVCSGENIRTILQSKG